MSNDIELYSKTDMLDTATIEMIAYGSFTTEGQKVLNNVIDEEINTDVASAGIKELEAKTKKSRVAEIKALQIAKAEELRVAKAKAEELRVAEAKKIEAREFEEGLTNLASAGNITQEFASLSPSLVNRNLSIDLSVGMEDLETPSEVDAVENINTDLVLTDNLIEQKEKMEVIVVDRSNRDIKDESFYYSKKPIPTIPSTVLNSTVKGVRTEKLRMLDLGRGFRSTGLISVLNPSRQCK